MISNCGHDERNKYSGGVAGDQTGTEWQVVNWYNRPWKCVLRHPDANIRAMIASMARATAGNNHIGYDQSQRGSFWDALSKNNYDPAKITTNCEADCSSGVAAIVKATGYKAGINKLKDVSTACYTGNLRAELKAAGFEVLTESKYLTSDAYLLMGDIMLNDGAHTAINLTNGSKTSNSYGSSGDNKTVKLDSARSFDKSLNANYEVTAAGLNMRAGAGKSKKIITVLKNGDKVRCYGYYTDVSGTKWLYVVFKQHTGFCSSKHLKRK